MIKVITYGTYDLLHYGHIRLLERAKMLGDYLIVGVTAEDFDKTRGKINVKQTLMERVEAVRATGIADEIIIEEYEGQKIDDIQRYNVDVFAIGSDWVGKFDYLNDYCKVVYLERTPGVSSSEIRASENKLTLGIVGETNFILKFYKECLEVNGVTVAGFCSNNINLIRNNSDNNIYVTDDYEQLLKRVDSVYIISSPHTRYDYAKTALNNGKHVLCESPIALNKNQAKELFEISKTKNLVFEEAIKTAYSTAYHRLLLLLKCGEIGDVISVDVTCTSQRKDTFGSGDINYDGWNSICTWGPTAMLPIFQILGTNYEQKRIVSKVSDKNIANDLFTKVTFEFTDSVATVVVGKGVKSEGDMVISGTKGYVYVPAPWWKTDYFEIRYENAENNKRYFYQLEGEGIRHEIVSFIKSIQMNKNISQIDETVSTEIANVISDFYKKRDVKFI